MPRSCQDTVDNLYMTSLSLTSGMSLLRLWSAITSALTGPFRQGPWHPLPVFLWSSVLCCAGEGFSWSPHPPCQAPGKTVPSGNECYFKEILPIRKITSKRLFLRLLQHYCLLGLPHQPAHWNNPGWWFFWQLIQNLIAFALDCDSVFLFLAWRICKVRADQS